VSTWNHSLLLAAFSAPKSSRRNVYNEAKEPTPPSHQHDIQPSQKTYHAVRTKDELDALLRNEEFNKADTIQLVEIFMKRDDTPVLLRKQAEATSKANNPDA
jgi:pyruvate decarboxylase